MVLTKTLKVLLITIGTVFGAFPSMGQGFEAPVLLLPHDGDTVLSASPLLFSWLPMTSSSGQLEAVNFKLYRNDGTAGQVMVAQSKPALFIERGLNTTAMQYPTYAPNLTPGWYVWQLSKPYPFRAGEEEYQVEVKSEAWHFYVPTDKSGCIVTFRPDKHAKVFQVPITRLITIETQGLSQDLSRERIYCKIMEAPDKQISDLYIPLNQGPAYQLNLYDVLPQAYLKPGKVLYLEVKDENGKVLFLKLTL